MLFNTLNKQRLFKQQNFKQCFNSVVTCSKQMDMEMFENLYSVHFLIILHYVH